MKKTKPFKLSTFQSLESTVWAKPVILKNDKEEVKIVSIDKDSLLYQNYPILFSDGTRCSVNGKNPENSKFTIIHDIKPPIIDGRIVSDKTFAIRFLNFLDGVQVNDLCGEEELEYLLGVAGELLEWQINTVSSEEEISYLRNNKINI